MNAATEGAVWRAELLGWAVRGGACALPSACWAVLAGYRTPIHGVAIVAGVAAYVVVFAAGCHRGERRHSPWPAAWRTGAWLKVGFAGLGALGSLGMNLAMEVPWLREIQPAGGVVKALFQAPLYLSMIGLDSLTGWGAIEMARKVFDFGEVLPRGGLLPVGGATLFVVLTQGGAVALQVGIFAVVARLWRGATWRAGATAAGTRG